MKNIILLIFLFIAVAVQAQPQWVIYTTNNSGLPSNLVGGILIDSNNVKWITTNNGFVKLQDTTWTVYDTLNSGLPQNACGVIRKDKKNNIWLSCGGKGIIKYDGVNWTVYNNENTGYPVNWTAVGDVDDYNNKWIVGAGLFKFNDTNWVWYNTGNSGLPTNETKCVLVKNNIVWVGTYMGGLVRFDGVNWTVYNTLNSGLPSNWVRMITSDLQNNLWFATFFGGLAKYNESQNIWTVYNTTNSGLHHNNLYSIYVDNNNVKWIGGGGMAIFNDTTWQIFTYPFITEVLNFSKDRYGNMWICSDIGLYVYNPAGVVGVENNSAKVIDDFELFQNYPNPFNSMTNIQFQVPLCHSGESRNPLVVIKVFNILGREVKTLVNEYKQPGTYQVSFNAEGLSSGIYFYKMTAGDFSKTKKLILIK